MSRQIRDFRAVMAAETMTSAARMIRITQPASSRLIRDLETELRFAPFKRSGDSVEPTTRARAFREKVERSFVGLQRIKEFADELRHGRVRDCGSEVWPAMAKFLPHIVARFSRERPDLLTVPRFFIRA